MYDVRLTGSTTFRENGAFRGGAIYNDDGDEEDGIPAATTSFPEDTVFEGNDAEVREGVIHTHAFVLIVR